MDIEKTIKNLELRGFKVKHFKSGEEASAYLDREIDGTQVGIGGSTTVQQLGLFEMLQKHNSVYWHWKAPGEETLKMANSAPVYITSANAITEGGEILNIDGNGNRLAAQVYGKKKVYIVSGTNKICPDFDSALYRARNIAAVKNCKRFDNNNPCKTDDKCHDCRMKTRLCNALLVLWAHMNGMDTELILIDEELGF